MPSAATWKDLEMITLSEVGQTEKDTMWYGFCEQSLKKKNDTNEFTYKTEAEPQSEKTNMITEG